MKEVKDTIIEKLNLSSKISYDLDYYVIDKKRFVVFYNDIVNKQI